MSIEKEIPKDISKYESKLISAFTTRQVVCGVPGILLGVGTYFLLRNFIEGDLVFILAFIVALPLLLCGWYKPYGIPFEKYISIVFVSQVLAPKNRKYVTENTYKIPKETQDKETENKKTHEKAKPKKNKKIIYEGEFKRYL